MEKVPLISYGDMLPRIDRVTCGTVYPLSVAQGIQPGDIYATETAALFWHHSGFAFLFGACDDDFLRRVYENFLSPDSVTARRFILFATNPKVTRFFEDKENLVSGKRYFFVYPNHVPPPCGRLSAHLKTQEISRELFDKIQGTITPRFSWADASSFLDRGKGYCITDGNTVAAWTFSAAVSADEIDIGVETRIEYRHLGLGTVAAGQMIQYCLERHKRPVWACSANNVASRKLAEKTGFVKTAECDTFKKSDFQ